MSEGETTATLGRMLTKVKDPIPSSDKHGVIYKIRCECRDFYIEETGRTLDTKLKEHKAPCRLGALIGQLWLSMHGSQDMQLTGRMWKYYTLQPRTYR